MADSVSADCLQRFRLILDSEMRELSVAEQRYQTSTNHLVTKRDDGTVKCGLGPQETFPGLTQAHRAVPG